MGNNELSHWPAIYGSPTYMVPAVFPIMWSDAGGTSHSSDGPAPNRDVNEPMPSEFAPSVVTTPSGTNASRPSAMSTIGPVTIGSRKRLNEPRRSSPYPRAQ